MYKKTSKIEKLTKDFFKRILPNRNVKYNYRPDWLKNPKTGYNLELDIYYASLKFAIEVDGFTHKIDNYQKEKDRYKDMVCNLRGVYLYRVSDLKKLLGKPLGELLEKLGIKYDLHNLSYSFKKKLKSYNSRKRKHNSRRYNKIVKDIKMRNKWGTSKIYEVYSIIQARETAGNLARMKNKK